MKKNGGGGWDLSTHIMPAQAADGVWASGSPASTERGMSLLLSLSFSLAISLPPILSLSLSKYIYVHTHTQESKTTDIHLKVCICSFPSLETSSNFR